ncbi:uncharacterized protein DFL_000098 [Arthrobotrys flagrans]|uniref:Uncharacterized protein n=1 Tax=Arthrobotrys flagrans TaxID=97331 RepID=A0A437AD63_ARTFL|nr:hypothetical protein DFL_000098 [Arthrobotrys flagrans]
MNSNPADDQPPEDIPNIPSISPAVPLVAAISNANALQISLLGQMPNEVLENILNRVGQPSIGAFGLAASWCQAHADEMFYRSIELTPVTLIWLALNSQHIPKIREIKIDCRMVGIMNINTINFIANVPNLRILSFHSVNARLHARVLYYILKFTPPSPNLRRIEISIGHNLSPQGPDRIRGNDDPVWDELEMNTHPNLKELSYDFGPMAPVITRMDGVVYSTFAHHRHQMKVLEIKTIQLRRHTQHVRDSLKHFIFRCAEEEVNPAAIATPELLETIETFQQNYIDCFASDTLEVFRLYSETRKAVTQEREINLDEVCRIFPNLKELDYVTRVSWSANLRATRLDPERRLRKLTSFVHPGATQTRTEWGHPARYITDSTLQASGPIVTAPRSVMDHLTRYWFPNIHNYGWYYRDSTSALNVAGGTVKHRIRIEYLRSVWFVLHRNWSGFVSMLALYAPRGTYKMHWFGPGSVTLVI